MTGNATLRRFLGTWLLVLLAAPALAVEVTLDSVTAMSGGGEAELRVDGRAKFQFDPVTNVLTSTGIWTAQHVFGPNQLTRFSHQFEDFTVSADGKFSVRSYECLEGTFGAIQAANTCGNYRFGPNGIDDGGAVDDVVVGPRKSLAGFIVSALTWDGESLVVILAPPGDPVAEVYTEHSLELQFSPVKPRATAR